MAAVAPEAPEMATEMTEIQTPQDSVEQSQEASTAHSPGPAILKVTGDEIEEESPPLTYIDFLPQCFGCRIEGSEPTYAEFQ